MKKQRYRNVPRRITKLFSDAWLGDLLGLAMAGESVENIARNFAEEDDYDEKLQQIRWILDAVEHPIDGEPVKQINVPEVPTQGEIQRRAMQARVASLEAMEGTRPHRKAEGRPRCSHYMGVRGRSGKQRFG